MAELTIEESKSRIKQVIQWFPGATIPVGRQSGKTTAIIEMIHEQYGGKACYITRSIDMLDFARYIYRGLWPEDAQPIFASSAKSLVGQTMPIFVDEWFLLNSKDQQVLEDFGSRVVCKIGTYY